MKNENINLVKDIIKCWLLPMFIFIFFFWVFVGFVGICEGSHDTLTESFKYVLGNVLKLIRR